MVTRYWDWNDPAKNTASYDDARARVIASKPDELIAKLELEPGSHNSHGSFMNALGNVGWELVSHEAFTMNGTGQKDIWHYKRPLR